MKLKVKILLGFGILLLILVGIVMYSVIILQNSQTTIKEILKTNTIISLKEITISLTALQNRFFAATIIIVLLAFIAVLFGIIAPLVISTSLINPVYTLTHLMKEVEKKNYNINVNITSKDEFGEMAKAFTGIIKQLKTGTRQSEISDSREKYKRDLEIARRIQVSTCPPVPAHDELEIAASMSPAKDVGGDFYNLVLDKDKNLWIGIGDVSGNGLTPALIVMMAETAFNNYVLEKGTGATPKDAIISVNKTLTENIRIRLNQKYFMSMNFLKYAGSGKFLQAGSHLDIIVYRNETRTCDLYPTDGVYMGIIPDISGHTADKPFNINVDDILVVYTNGVIEAKNKYNIENLFGIEALIDTIVINGHKDASNIMEAIRNKALDWCGHNPVDDITVVVAKRVK